ncbi:MAG TPA: hypothetical protein VM509_10010 [Planctomycetota bacterium]|nr:hypothetical protein [Planctomycetota bacterium]
MKRITTLESLRELGFGLRLGLTALLCVMAGGFLASGAHLIAQHENRDERPGVSLVDLEGAYHGVAARAPVLSAIERGHPPELTAAERDLLLAWLAGRRVSEDYDSLELGDDAPAEILARRCVACHSRAGLAGEHADAKLALATWEDVSKVAFSRRIDPLPEKVVAASTHAHALALAPLSIVLLALLSMTRFGPRWAGALCAASGVALFLDLAGWWIARSVAGLAIGIAIAGSVYALATGITLVLVLADLWLPRRAV